MTLADFGKSLLRRWYAVVLCLALTAGGAYFIYKTVPPTYESTANIVLIPPDSLVTEEGNPYLFMGGLDQAVSVLVVKLNSAEVSDELVTPGTDYEVVADTRAPGPLIAITTVGATAEQSAALRDEILLRLPDELETMQDQLNVADEARIQMMTVVQSAEPTKLVKEQMRTLLGVIAVGLAGTVIIAAVLDRWTLARAARKAATEEEEEDPDVNWSVTGQEIDDFLISSGKP